MLFAPSVWQARLVERQRGLALDKELGVDTGGKFFPSKATVSSANWNCGSAYQGTDPVMFREVLDALRIAYSEFTFIDLGSGKGRALLLAARYPFRRIVGVEYSPELNKVAQQNVACCRDPAKVCHQIEPLCMDAADFQFPDGPLVVFLYNPFGRELMAQVVRNLADSYRRSPRRMMVVYFNPEHGGVWEEAGFLVRTEPSRWMTAVYDTLGPLQRLSPAPAALVDDASGKTQLRPASQQPEVHG